MFMPFGCSQQLFAMAFQVLTSTLESLATAPFSAAFEPASLLFHQFPPADVVTSDLLLPFCVPVQRLRPCISGAGEKQTGPKCESKELSMQTHIKPPVYIGWFAD
jgi:hypothetical protein